MKHLFISTGLFLMLFIACDDSSSDNQNNLEISVEDKVLKTITNLPEYHDAADFVKAKTNGKQSLSSIIEAPNDEHSDYYIQVGYNEEAWFEPLLLFYINPETLKVTIEDQDVGDIISVEAWRKRKDIN